ncbi:hypothetical protein [Mycolicibacterium peregrinum]|uniref:Uncharacterized protein n=1 Tax=Mycolicibacterium peregrinum TaxID=43304 RepID=A0A1A0V821_MYCPR|nr:hypothetical protein [Mycolicibacterium peregrinum]OBB79336.1 hypothetical protein A5779_12680 [Mycolicibacterium peregrinum]
MSPDEFFDTVDAVKATLIERAKSSFSTNGVVPTPQMWAFSSTSSKGLMGYAVCRDYTRGADAALGIGSLGILADAMHADLLVLMWEEADLRTSLYGPSDDHPTGIVILEATLHSHELTWHPFDFTVVGYNSAGLPRLDVRYGDSSDIKGGPLPEVIAKVLAEWRSRQVASFEEARATIEGAAADGYQISLVA